MRYSAAASAFPARPWPSTVSWSFVGRALPEADDRQFDASVPPELQDHQRAPRLVDGFWRPQFQDTPRRTATSSRSSATRQRSVFNSSADDDKDTEDDLEGPREAAPAWEPPRPCRLRRAP